MVEYFKFWLMKELAPLFAIALAFGAFGLFIGALAVVGKIASFARRFK